MISSSGVAALAAHSAFVVLLAAGWLTGELGPRGVVVFLALWVGGWLGLPLVPYGQGLFFVFVALLDIALVFAIFKGDVPIR